MSSTITRKDIGLLGASLRRIDPRLLKRDPTGDSQTIWFQGGEPYFDVYFTIIEGRASWFQLTLRGRAVTWSRETGRVTTGRTNELHAETASTYPGSKLLREDATPNRGFISFARAILASRADEPLFVEMAQVLARPAL